ncbi:MAG: hypothetical protein R3C59_19400 [Planctomycetaceae bacterium]
MDRQRIERQLKQATLNLAECEKQLDKEKVPADKRSKNAKWRAFDADLRALKRRMNAVKAVEAREAAAIDRKNGVGVEEEVAAE